MIDFRTKMESQVERSLILWMDQVLQLINELIFSIPVHLNLTLVE